MAGRTGLTGMVLTAAFVLLNTLNVFAINPDNKEKSIKEIALQNLLTGIQAENTGLKKSSIYFSGLYKVEESVDVLINQLDKEEDPAVRILIALALYKIGTEEGIAAIQNLAVNDDNLKVRRMSKAILDETELNPDFAINVD